MRRYAYAIFTGHITRRQLLLVVPRRSYSPGSDITMEQRRVNRAQTYFRCLRNF